MKICVVQTRSVRGDIQANIVNHKKLIKLAVSHGANIIIFPELSLTGYEPGLAKELAVSPNDRRFDEFQKIADENHVTIGAGAPTKNTDKPRITMILFQPGQSRQTYYKKYLHSDEEPFFSSGESSVSLSGDNNTIALAICYELSVPEHSENAFKNGAGIYLASVAKTERGVEKAAGSLGDIARKYSMYVLMSNCIGPCDNFIAAGKTAAWNKKGSLIAQLNDSDEGILILDTDTEEIIKM